MKHLPPIIPPRAYTTLLELALPRGIRRESILGDLCEEFRNGVETGSLNEARRWYKRQALRIVIRHLFHRRLNGWQQNPIGSHQPRHGPNRGDPFMSTILADLRFAVGIILHSRRPRRSAWGVSLAEARMCPVDCGISSFRKLSAWRAI